jgi:hypothetical protein
MISTFYFSAMKEKKEAIHESVKIPTGVVAKVREHVKKTKQTIGGFFELAAEKELKMKK